MEVYKFGGASVKDAQNIRQLAEIVKQAPRPLVIVVSAMGKTTNALEKIIDAYFFHNKDFSQQLQKIKNYHSEIAQELFPDSHSVFNYLERLFLRLENELSRPPSMNYDFDYDRIIVFGELISTTIISQYLNLQGQNNLWIDAREIIKTDNNHREGNVDWQLTETLIRKQLDFSNTDLYVTQGFIASDRNNQSISLGREGSDFSAAIIASALSADKLTVWKDVDGIYSADPKRFSQAQKINNLSYRETIELAFYGAKVIHPKTLKPLKDKNIPLYVKSFVNPQQPGTVIHSFAEDLSPKVPVIIVKDSQILISLAMRDASFITEKEIEKIFAIINRHKSKNNVMQRSALSFSFCTDYDHAHTPAMIEELKNHFTVKYNTDLTLYTIRHYTREVIEKITAGKEILLHQQSRHNVYFVVKETTEVPQTSL